MQKLRHQARHVTFGVIIFSAYSYFFLVSHSVVFKEYADMGALLGITWTIVPVMLIYAYEAFIWKCFNMQIDFGGYWDFTEDQYEWRSSGALRKDYSAYGHMRIVQDTRSIGIVEGQTHKGEPGQSVEQEVSSWWSKACDLDATAKLITAAIGHKSSGMRVGGSVEFGVEIISVSRTNRFGRPIELSSVVYHCVGHGKPRIVYCRYVRRGGRHGTPVRGI